MNPGDLSTRYNLTVVSKLEEKSNWKSIQDVPAPLVLSDPVSVKNHVVRMSFIMMSNDYVCHG